MAMVRMSSEYSEMAHGTLTIMATELGILHLVISHAGLEPVEIDQFQESGVDISHSYHFSKLKINIRLMAHVCF